ncbi:MAG: segregation/condensation protein A [Eubacteriaceae bacterium]|nr:segregation/condensation protein A [Eubacteriaceae bacterium]
MEKIIAIEKYEGPLDLLLALIKKNKIDIFDIPIAQITEQYMSYIYMLGAFDVEIASNFVTMAARLLEIKSGMMLPSSKPVDEEDDDPRLLLAEQLQEYAAFKMAARFLQRGEDSLYKIYTKEPSFYPQLVAGSFAGELETEILAGALKKVLLRKTGTPGEQPNIITLSLEEASVQDRIEQMLTRLSTEGVFSLSSFLGEKTARSQVVAAFLAMLELSKQNQAQIMQDQPFSEIYISKPENQKMAGGANG